MLQRVSITTQPNIMKIPTVAVYVITTSRNLRARYAAYPKANNLTTFCSSPRVPGSKCCECTMMCCCILVGCGQECVKPAPCLKGSTIESRPGKRWLMNWSIPWFSSVILQDCSNLILKHSAKEPLHVISDSPFAITPLIGAVQLTQLISVVQYVFPPSLFKSRMTWPHLVKSTGRNAMKFCFITCVSGTSPSPPSLLSSRADCPLTAAWKNRSRLTNTRIYNLQKCTST
jgi:hypothetical protein